MSDVKKNNKLYSTSNSRMMSIFRDLLKHHVSNAVVFFFVGGITALIYFLIFTLFWKVFSLNYLIAITIAYVLSAIFQFSSNRGITFKNSRAGMQQQLFRYIIQLLISYLITVFIVHAMVNAMSFSPYIGVVVAICFTAIMNYLIARYWVFQQ